MGLSLIVIVALAFGFLGLLLGVLCGVAYERQQQRDTADEAMKVLVAEIARTGAFRHDGKVYRVSVGGRDE